MSTNFIETKEIVELRAKLQHLQGAADELSRLQSLLTQDLEGILHQMVDLPQDDDEFSQFPKEVFVLPEAEPEAAQPLEDSRISKLRQQLLQGRELTDQLTHQQDRLRILLKAALEQLFELHHAEVEGRNELGGEG